MSNIIFHYKLVVSIMFLSAIKLPSGVRLCFENQRGASYMGDNNCKGQRNNRGAEMLCGREINDELY